MGRRLTPLPRPEAAALLGTVSFGGIVFTLRELRPWVDGPKDLVSRIRPQLVTGYRLAPGA